MDTMAREARKKLVLLQAHLEHLVFQRTSRNPKEGYQEMRETLCVTKTEKPSGNQRNYSNLVVEQHELHRT